MEGTISFFTIISAPLTICGYPNFPDKLVHFQGKYPIFTKIVVYGSMDRTTSEESWLHQKTQTGFTDTPGLTLTPITPKSLC